MATEVDYSHRSAVQKLGVKPDQRVEVAGDVGSGLRRDVKEASGAVWSSPASSTARSSRRVARGGRAGPRRVPARGCATPATCGSSPASAATRATSTRCCSSRRQAARPDRQQDLLDRRRALGHPLRGPALAAQAGARSRRGLVQRGARAAVEHGQQRLDDRGVELRAGVRASSARASASLIARRYGRSEVIAW